MAKEQHVYAVYIMASGKNGTLHIGVTGNLISRVVQHKAKEIPGFTARHKITQLVW